MVEETEERYYNIALVMFTLLVVFAGIIYFLMTMIADAKEECDTYYKERIDEFIKDNNICLGSISERISTTELEMYFNKTGWGLKNES